MPDEKTPPRSDAEARLRRTAEALFDFAIGREELKHIMTLLPEAAPVDRSKVEYELQLLKIITVGWSITYFLEAFPQKEPLAVLYWEAVREFSQRLSETTELMTGEDVNYFEVLRARLDVYVQALARKSDAAEPAAVIGPAFAGNCDAGGEVFTVMGGSRMFIAATGRVKQMLEALVQSSA
jgi:hypothetical protein